MILHAIIDVFEFFILCLVCLQLVSALYFDTSSSFYSCLCYVHYCYLDFPELILILWPSYTILLVLVLLCSSPSFNYMGVLILTHLWIAMLIHDACLTRNWNLIDGCGTLFWFLILRPLWNYLPSQIAFFTLNPLCIICYISANLSIYLA